MANVMGTHAVYNTSIRKILGVEFFSGTGEEAISKMKHGGLLVVPAAPGLKDLATNTIYREALLHADLCIPDSAYMVLLWNAMEGDRLCRLSGLEYLRDLLLQPDVRLPGNTFWVMSSSPSSKRNLRWLASQGIEIPEQNVYIAPMYEPQIEDLALLQILKDLRPQHIVVTLGGGTQEPLGFYLKRQLNYRPAIHCIGAAIGFLSGDQVHIPVWADRFYLGWLFRCISAPRRFIPRYWQARKLFSLMKRYRSELPPIKARQLLSPPSRVRHKHGSPEI